jgi:parallel beta-helix repeat protein
MGKILRSALLGIFLGIFLTAFACATVTTTSTKVTYAGSGSTGPFNFSFPVFSASDLQVIEYDPNGNPTTLTLNTDYTVSGLPASGAGSGSVTLTNALATGYTLVIMRAMQDLQTQNWSPGILTSTSLNNSADSLEMQIQQAQEEINRSILLSPLDSGPFVLPPPAERANRALMFDSSGNPTVGELLSTALPATVLSPLSGGGFQTPGPVNTGTTGQFQIDSNGNVRAPSIEIGSTGYFADGAMPVNVKIEAKGDGIQDDTTAWQDTVNKAEAAGVPVYCPDGIYKLSANIAVTGTIKIFGQNNGCKLIMANAGTPTAPRYFFNLTNAPDSEISGIYFMGSATSPGSPGSEQLDTGIHADSTSPGLKVHGNIFEALNIGINLVGTPRSRVYDNKFRNIIGSATASTGYGILASNGADWTDIYDNDFDGYNYPTDSSSVMRHAIYISSGTSHAIAHHNTIRGCIWAGININTSSTQTEQVGLTITGNTLDHCVNSATTPVYSGSINVYGNHSGFTLDSNTILNSGGDGISDAGLAGDDTHLCGWDTIVGNTINSVGYFGITVEGSGNNTVGPNNIYSVSLASPGTYSGVRLTSTAEGGASVPGQPANNRIDLSTIASPAGQMAYTLADNADHPGIINYVSGITPGASILNGNGTLIKTSGGITKTVTASAYTLSSMDGTVTFSAPIGIALALPPCNSTSMLGWKGSLENVGAGTVTGTANGSDAIIESGASASSFSLGTNHSANLACDGNGHWALVLY